MQGRDVLHHMRGLRALVDRQPRFGGVPVRHHRAWLQRHPGVPAEDKLRFGNFLGTGKGSIDLARVQSPFKGEIVPERSVDDRRFRIKRGAHIRHRLEFLVSDRDDFGSVFRGSAACGHHGGNGLALPADTADRDCPLGRGLQPLQMREHADPRRDDGRQFLTGDDGDHARHLFRRARVDCNNVRVRMRRADKHYMRHPRQLQVADVKSAPLHQPIEIWPRHHLADVGIRPIERRERLLRFRR